MKKFYFLLVCSFTGSALLAQPNLTLGNNAPQAGDSFLAHFAPYQSPGASGANVTWDFSNLVSDSSKTLDYVDPANTPSGTQFPNADVCQVDPSGGYVYFDYDNGGMEYIGADAAGIIVESTDPELFLDFPLTYGTTWSDTQSGTIPFGTRSGSNTGNADAYGTLILPWGTVNNVLRVHLAQDFTDQSIITIDYDFDTYWFFGENSRFPLLQIQTMIITPSLGPQITNQWAHYADQSAVGIGEEMEIVGNMRIYPNPATQAAFVEYTLESSEELTMDLLDMAGRKLISKELGSKAPGFYRQELDVADLQSGTYIVQFRSLNGRSIERLLVH